MNQVVTFGCRLNYFESEVIRDCLTGSDDNKIVINSCAVTKEAERQLRQSIRKLRKKHPTSEIILTGCAAQIDPRRYANMPEIDRILGNEEKLQKSSYHASSDAKVRVNDIMSVKETALHMVEGLADRARAFVQVQTGCDHRCTFCIIPYGRGNSRSVPIGEIVTQVRTLVDNGYNEVVLTGVDLTDYGAHLPGKPSLGEMVKRLLALVPDLPRLRLSSLDVAEIDPVLEKLLISEPRLMPYLHLSVQAGNDIILKRMKRRHTRQDVIDFCHKIRQEREDVSFGADIISGFPTESDTMFDDSLTLITEAGIQFTHIFPYSEREGTPAANIPNQVAVAVRKERAKLLRLEGESQLRLFCKKQIGKEVTAIVEKGGVLRGENFLSLYVDEVLDVGALVKVKTTGLYKDGLRAETI